MKPEPSRKRFPKPQLSGTRVDAMFLAGSSVPSVLPISKPVFLSRSLRLDSPVQSQTKRFVLVPHIPLRYFTLRPPQVTKLYKYMPTLCLDEQRKIRDRDPTFMPIGSRSGLRILVLSTINESFGAIYPEQHKELVPNV